MVTAKGARFFGRYLPCVIGREGVTQNKTEGDGATPTGSHQIVAIFYRPDRMAPPVPWARPIRPGDLWCDDPTHSRYNQRVSAPFSASHERLFRSDPLYDLVIVTDWNWPLAVAGKGSAIFVHRWRKAGTPTQGCVAFEPQDLLWISLRIRQETRLIVQNQV